MNTVGAYKEILSVLDKYDEVLKKQYRLDIRIQLKILIKSQEVASLFDIDLGIGAFEGRDSYVKLNDYQFIALYGEEYNRTVSWLDSGVQPENEWLYVISFPTGAYIFGDTYPTKIFQLFFDELKSYSPKYSDSHNNNLYFCKSKAKKVHEEFKPMLEKYRLLAREECKLIEIKNLEEKIARLKVN